MTLSTFTKIILLGSMISLVGCANKVKEAVNEVKYSAYEAIGYEKRDLFKRQVAEVKEGQDDSKEEFQDALEQLQKVYGYKGNNLEKEYRELKESYDEAKEEAGKVSISISKLETIATDLFKEWNKEITEISSSDLRAKSQGQYNSTQDKYRTFFAQLKKSEAKMAPVLKKFNDQVLFLKHNLNAAAIAGLKVESDRIQGDITKLIEDMNQSMKQADELIKTL